MSTTLLLDADIIAFQIAATSQRSFAWPGLDKPSVSLDPWEDVTARVDAEIAGLKARLKATDVIVCLSCPTSENWRLDHLPTYKCNRTYADRPEYLQPIKDYMEAGYPSYRRPRLEADDIMGILSTHPTLVKGRRIIVSEDKDMQTIPGLLFNPAKDTRVRTITQRDADRYHMLQTLIGDATDGYSGCPGFGKEKADQFLAAPYVWQSHQHVLKSGPRKGQEETRWQASPLSDGNIWQGVVTIYEKAGLTEEDALVQARVARILRHTDYDFSNKEPIPWSPRSKNSET